MRSAVLLAVGVSCGLVGLAQGAPKFEVVSIKPSNAVMGPGFFASSGRFQPGGRFVGTNVTALSLVGLPFHEGEPPFPGIDNAEALPGWVRTQFFNVDARVGDALANETLTNTPLGAALVRSMLEDRFKFRAHLESRDLPAFALKVAKANGTLGPHIHPSPDCEALRRERIARGDTPFAPSSGPPAPGERRCGLIWTVPDKVAGANTMTGTGVQLSTLAVFSLRVHLVGLPPVVDQTGLPGLYDFDLTWADDGPARDSASSLPDGPSIFTALQEQLGLKLESTHVSRHVIVVDHIEPPTAD